MYLCIEYVLKYVILMWLYYSGEKVKPKPTGSILILIIIHTKCNYLAVLCHHDLSSIFNVLMNHPSKSMLSDKGIIILNLQAFNIIPTAFYTNKQAPINYSLFIVYCPAGLWQIVASSPTFVQCDPGICLRMDTGCMGCKLLSSCTPETYTGLL